MRFWSFVSDLCSTIGRDSELKIIDVRYILGVQIRCMALVEKPYFKTFMKLMSKHGKPMLKYLRHGFLCVKMKKRTCKSKLFRGIGLKEVCFGKS